MSPLNLPEERLAKEEFIYFLRLYTMLPVKFIDDVRERDSFSVDD